MATHSSILGLENTMDRGACWATVCVVTKSQTQLSESLIKGCVVCCTLNYVDIQWRGIRERWNIEENDRKR